jgi:hypothetical protein
VRETPHLQSELFRKLRGIGNCRLRGGFDHGRGAACSRNCRAVRTVYGKGSRN